jgi:hypothetical protein
MRETAWQPVGTRVTKHAIGSGWEGGMGKARDPARDRPNESFASETTELIS